MGWVTSPRRWHGFVFFISIRVTRRACRTGGRLRRASTPCWAAARLSDRRVGGWGVRGQDDKKGPFLQGTL